MFAFRILPPPDISHAGIGAVLHRIVYVSRAAPAPPAAGLAEVCRIIRAAHRNNPDAGVTGALFAVDGCFAQAIEGPAAAVEALFERLRHDPRHRGLELRSRERGLCRLFPGQAMALRTGSGLDPGLMAEFGYRRGFPVEDFPAAVLLEFLVTACRRHVLLDKRRPLS
jgi:Sensors of blue-light using FAD